MGARHIFWKALVEGFPKTYDADPLLWQSKLLVIIKRCATKTFWLEEVVVCPHFSDQKISITTRLVIEIFLSLQA
jgi:hypothetical protein